MNALLDGRRVDPFMEYLSALPTWDRNSRLHRWIFRCWYVDEGYERLAYWASLYLFLGAVHRTLDPGCKLDEVPIIVGPQGIGKTTAVEQMFPPEHQGEWYASGLNLAAPEKERVERLQGRVVIECGEMAGSGKAELESLKDFVTRRDDGAVRLSYRRNPEPMPRRCIMVGTTNDDEFLPNDPTGNRRFVPVRVHGGGYGNVIQTLAARDQLWAEALWLYRAGMQARLPDDLKALQAEVNEEHRRSDGVLENAVVTWLERNGGKFLLGDLITGVGLVGEHDVAARATQRDVARATAILRRLGYERLPQERGSGGGRVRFWDKAVPA